MVRLLERLEKVQAGAKSHQCILSVVHSEAGGRTLVLEEGFSELLPQLHLQQKRSGAP